MEKSALNEQAGTEGGFIRSLKEIEAAIRNLSPQEYDELFTWLGEYTPQKIDAHLKADLDAGRMDDLIDRAIEDYKAGRATPL